MELDKLYATRFSEEDISEKDAVWRVLCNNFFQKMVDENDTVLDLGSGYGEFIRHIKCGKKIAVDINPDAKKWIPPGAKMVSQPSWNMNEIENSTVNVVFASNFFEHLPTKNKLLETLMEINRVLDNGGRLIVLQPNLAYLNGRFFDFLDHHLPLTHKSMSEALEICGFDIHECIPRFLPFTTRSRLPKNSLLVTAYLRFSFFWRILGKQMLILAFKAPPDDGKR